MTLNDISRKLIKNNLKQYALFFFSVLFSITMTGAYGVLQYSYTVANVLVDGGSTQTISQAMFFGSMLGIIVFLIYADSIFLKYKSKEIGIFLSLGIDRRTVQKIITKEFTMLFQVAALLGLLSSVPLAYLCWNTLNVFLATQETVFTIGWMGLIIDVIFASLSWLILKKVNQKYVQTVDILKILKSSDESEATKDGKARFLIIALILVPIGIIGFFTLQNMGGFLNTTLAFASLVLTIWAVYTLIIQLACIGDILKRYNRRIYYKNIVFYNLMKQKIQQYTRSIFVATLLIVFTVFGIGFIAAGFIDGYNVALNESYDYTINVTYEQPQMNEQRIFEIAEESSTTITGTKKLEGLLVGVQNTYKDGTHDWTSRIVVSQSNFNSLAEADISIQNGSFAVYHDSSMEYKLNAFFADSSLFYNPTTKQEFSMTQTTPVCYDRLFNIRSFFSSFLILNDEDYKMFDCCLEDKYKVVSYMVNVENWKQTTVFQNSILKAVTDNNEGKIFVNWHNSATFSKMGGQAEYLIYEGNETRIARIWPLYPLSKLSSTTTQFEAFATYLMLMLFIAIVAFVSAIMLIGLKLISTIWDDAAVYENLRRFGMKQKKIKGLVTRQMVVVFFIPTVLGCSIGSFTTYRIMLVSGVTYIRETMKLVGCVCALVFLIQFLIFFVLHSKIIKHYI